ncbi:hypothetical protein ACUZ8Y_19275 [Aeromonas veronii]|uniref:hypothetical protein n=1 Tax=Aeromonas veronii TaxID=654 RepID=UPI00406BAC62
MRASARYLLFIALLLPATGSAAPAFTLRACVENSDSYPWLLQSGEGVVQYHLKAVATALDAELVLTPLPWKRSLSGEQWPDGCGHQDELQRRAGDHSGGLSHA